MRVCLVTNKDFTHPSANLNLIFSFESGWSSCRRNIQPHQVCQFSYIRWPVNRDLAVKCYNYSLYGSATNICLAFCCQVEVLSVMQGGFYWACLLFLECWRWREPISAAAGATGHTWHTGLAGQMLLWHFLPSLCPSYVYMHVHKDAFVSCTRTDVCAASQQIRLGQKRPQTQAPWGLQTSLRGASGDMLLCCWMCPACVSHVCYQHPVSPNPLPRYGLLCLWACLLASLVLNGNQFKHIWIWLIFWTEALIMVYRDVCECVSPKDAWPHSFLCKITDPNTPFCPCHPCPPPSPLRPQEDKSHVCTTHSTGSKAAITSQGDLSDVVHWRRLHRKLYFPVLLEDADKFGNRRLPGYLHGHFKCSKGTTQEQYCAIQTPRKLICSHIVSGPPKTHSLHLLCHILIRGFCVTSLFPQDAPPPFPFLSPPRSPSDRIQPLADTEHRTQQIN